MDQMLMEGVHRSVWGRQVVSGGVIVWEQQGRGTSLEYLLMG